MRNSCRLPVRAHAYALSRDQNHINHQTELRRIILLMHPLSIKARINLKKMHSSLDFPFVYAREHSRRPLCTLMISARAQERERQFAGSALFMGNKTKSSLNLFLLLAMAARKIKFYCCQHHSEQSNEAIIQFSRADIYIFTSAPLFFAFIQTAAQKPTSEAKRVL